MDNAPPRTAGEGDGASAMDEETLGEIICLLDDGISGEALERMLESGDLTHAQLHAARAAWRTL